MMSRKSVFIFILAAACTGPGKDSGTGTDAGIIIASADTGRPVITADSPPPKPTAKIPVQDIPQILPTVQPPELVDFAKTLLGVPYLYGSTDPAAGFDCSGFITYVFNHFNIEVPRSSVDFTNVGRPVSEKEARVGDLILFTGTIDSIRIVGHMGIVTENADTLKFIHSTSGKANGVTITPLGEYYQRRFVKVIRIFRD